MKKPNTLLTKSTRGSHILKSLGKHKCDSIDMEKHNNENEEVLPPDVLVGPAEKETHSVSVYLT